MSARAQSAGAAKHDVISVKQDVVAITHVKVIDGTGAAAASDQTVVFNHGKISAVGASGSLTVPSVARTIDGTGKTLIPGIVGMHEHLFYVAPVDGPLTAVHPFYSFAPLYLAGGVTTARTGGSMDPYGDINIKALVERGELPGPHLDLTTPYLDGAPTLIGQMHELKDAAEAREFVRYWHSVGFTSAKAYTSITPQELGAAIDQSHKLGMKITGHLCSVGYRDAAELGIDNLEHGPFGAPDGELDTDKEEGASCTANYFQVLAKIVMTVDPDGPELKQTIATLVEHHVAITSTLAVLEGGNRPPMNAVFVQRTHELLNPLSWSHAMTARAMAGGRAELFAALLKKEMKFERNFAAAGGVLMAGCDPTGDGHTLAGLGDERNIELLTEAGFTTPEAIRIATLNGATYMGKSDQIGSIAVGKNADVVLLDGDLEKDVTAIERPVTVFKDGVGYDSNAIFESLRGKVGMQ
jgi:imidazolonepropionase-like amidohydrolase